MKFNSQPCTTKEQSKRLLALGLKKETTDMTGSELSKVPICHPYNKIKGLASDLNDKVYPAWSLHRLIELLPQWIDTTETSLKLTIDQGKLVCYRGIFDGVQTFVFGHTSLYDSIIDIIEKLIKEGYFNKEYLE